MKQISWIWFLLMHSPRDLPLHIFNSMSHYPGVTLKTTFALRIGILGLETTLVLVAVFLW